MAWFRFKQDDFTTVTLTVTDPTDMDRLLATLKSLQREPGTKLQIRIPSGIYKPKPKYAKKNSGLGGTLDPGPMVRPNTKFRQR